MINAILIVTIIIGWASHYAPGVMERVIENRLRWNHIQQYQVDGVNCYVAGRYASEIGKIVWIRALQGSWTRCLVVDCAGIADGGLEWMLTHNVLYELDFNTMNHIGRLGRGLRISVRRTNPFTGHYAPL